MTTPDIRGLIAKWRERYPADDEGAWQTLECADELEALLSEAAPQESKRARIADELRCDVTFKRCRDFGCSHEGAQDAGPDYRCPSCAAYEYLKGEAAPPAQSGWQPKVRAEVLRGCAEEIENRIRNGVELHRLAEDCASWYRAQADAMDPPTEKEQ